MRLRRHRTDVVATFGVGIGFEVAKGFGGVGIENFQPMSHFTLFCQLEVPCENESNLQ